MKLTIFGCCRQDSLYKYYNVSTIRDELTYPHYSSEALQAMRFCAGLIDEKAIATDFMFRSLVISNKKINYKKLHDDFKSTDLFAVEIATRKCYKFKGLFLHHICEEVSYGCNFFDEVSVVDLSDEEIENDILAMRSLVWPKKFFLITHFYTRLSGKRYELVCALKKIGRKLGIPVFDPVEAVGGVQKILPLLVDEPVCHHYNLIGHSVIRKLYTTFIRENFGLGLVWHKPYTSKINSIYKIFRHKLIIGLRALF